MKKYLIYRTPFYEGNVVVPCSTDTYPVTKTESWSEEGFNRALEDNTVQIVKFTSDVFLAGQLNTSGLTTTGAPLHNTFYYDSMLEMFGTHEKVVRYVKSKRPAKVKFKNQLLTFEEFLKNE